MIETPALTGLPAVLAKLNAEIALIEQMAEVNLRLAGHLVINRAKVYTPVDTSHLINSTYISVFIRPTKRWAEIGYTASYAPIVHENMKAQFRKVGATPKFLERALTETAPEVLMILKTGLIGGGIGGVKK